MFPTKEIANRCLSFVRGRAPPEAAAKADVIHLGLDVKNPSSVSLALLRPEISAVLCPLRLTLAQRSTGSTRVMVSRAEGPSSATVCSKMASCAQLTEAKVPLPLIGNPIEVRDAISGHTLFEGDTPSGPKTNGQPPASEAGSEVQESSRFLEERFGRNLDISFLAAARSAIRRRIAGALTSDLDLTKEPLPAMGVSSRGVVDLREDDVYLFPCGMNAIFNAHRLLLRARGSMKSINFGFSYVDTLKTLEKFGPGCLFLGRASEAELDELEDRLRNGEGSLPCSASSRATHC